ncbi:hypothetical protein HOO54_23565 [Bacillus sp. WMMC1349]|uniref:hypothetical protein n=1 Tax=Bacillus sp. WMMC1349 TaxID=2736254 RepID=UPI0015551AD3|nr:hypothetical protein [Bacillus sp. WMMC1349]NPC90993.1 hypothetical protein [Bacillus sp. WMMC1349]NPC91038.1 hypothetical protein [Bacillus sp. WMMC1349]NPC94977.1 hypothetical protein [Bacillus sp. WMMC1349]NPC95035.1 hypothetical protein [Bacillus sp. WMMC1349]NPC95069.1 hypothetical protein [Bacillus sp. WMMC1349]
MGGAFQTSRDIFTSDIWQNPVEFRLFFFIYGNAVFSEEGQRKGDVLVKRGQFLRSYRNLQKDLQYIENRSVKQYSLSRIKRAVDRLIKENRLKIEDTELGTLFTVVNYEVYQGLENYKKGNLERRENADGTETERRWNNNKNVKKVKKENNNNNKRLVFDEKQMQLAELLWKHVHINAPDMKQPNLDKWANTIRLMMERDGRTGKDIQEVILWSTKHEFWYKNILSADKLRKQYARLVVQKNEEERRGTRNGNQQPYGQSYGENTEEASGKVSSIFGGRVGRLRKKG